MLIKKIIVATAFAVVGLTAPALADAGQLKLSDITDGEKACAFYFQSASGVDEAQAMVIDTTAIAATTAIANQSAQTARQNTPMPSINDDHFAERSEIYRIVRNRAVEATRAMTEAMKAKAEAAAQLETAQIVLDGAENILFAYTGGFCDSARVVNSDIFNVEHVVAVQ